MLSSKAETAPQGAVSLFFISTTRPLLLCFIQIA